MRSKGCKQLIMVALAVVVLIFVYNSMKSGRHGLMYGRMENTANSKYGIVTCRDGGLPLFRPHPPKNGSNNDGTS